MKLQNGISYTVGVAAVDQSGNASPIRKAFVQTPIFTGEPTPDMDGGTADTDGTTAALGKSGCGCHLAGGDRSAIPWGAMLLLGLASWLGSRRRRLANASFSPTQPGRCSR
jgi:hypothetical protein